MYIVISKPKRMSSNAGCVHCIKVSLVDGTAGGGRHVRMPRTPAVSASRVPRGIRPGSRGFTLEARSTSRTDVPLAASRARELLQKGTARAEGEVQGLPRPARRSLPRGREKVYFAQRSLR